MFGRRILASAGVMICCGSPKLASADPAEGVVGAWTLVSADIHRDGYRIQVFGPDPSGMLMFGADAHYALVFLRRDLPRIASHDRTTETPGESQAIAQGSIAHFGTYAVQDDALVFHIQGGTFPNWTGASQRRKFVLAKDVLTYISPGSGGQPVEVILRRSR